MRKYHKFSFEITHLCNKNCKDCSHRISDSKYKYMTFDEYEKIYRSIKDLAISEIEIIGGEPLMHPQFSELMERISNDFKSARLVLITNGKLLPKLKKSERERFSRILITWYNGFNEEAIRTVIKEKNVFVTRVNFIKLDTLKKLNAKAAKEVYKRCPNNKQHRLVGTKLYKCCLAESIERTYLKHKVHVDITTDENWQKNLNNKPLHTACQHCISAKSIQNYSKLSANIESAKQFVLINSPLARFDFGLIWQTRRFFKNRNNWYKYQVKEQKQVQEFPRLATSS